MFLDFYALREEPFSLTPDPRFVFLSKKHKEAFAHLLYGINHRAGFIALTGEVGSGKTTVVRALLSQLDPDRYRTALIFNPSLSPTELLQTINREFAIPIQNSNRSSLLEALNLFLLQQNAEGRIIVLVIDEAQALEASVLEQIRLISNLETDREKLIQIVLAGQPEFGQILQGKEIRQLSQRITVRYHLEPMDFPDTVAYINHRLKVAGRKGGGVFSPRALKRIFKYSGGLPRLINAVCDRSLLAGYTRDQPSIHSRIAAFGIADLTRDARVFTLKRPLIMIPALGVLAILLAAGFYFAGRDFLNPFPPSQPVEATEESTAKDLIPTGEELSRSMAEELGKVPETESARRAFNTLAGFWKVPAAPASEQWHPARGWERAASDRKLLLYRFFGNLGAVLRIDTPAALELTLPGISGKRFISLVGQENGQLLVEPPIRERKILAFSELEKHWSGQGFLLWKDPLNLLPKISQSSKGSHITRLQELLRETGASGLPLTGVYDADTLAAVKEFQRSKGIAQDGIVGVQTLMFLYHSIDRFETPRLKAEPK